MPVSPAVKRHLTMGSPSHALNRSRASVKSNTSTTSSAMAALQRSFSDMPIPDIMEQPFLSFEQSSFSGSSNNNRDDDNAASMMNASVSSSVTIKDLAMLTSSLFPTIVTADLTSENGDDDVASTSVASDADVDTRISQLSARNELLEQQLNDMSAEVVVYEEHQEQWRLERQRVDTECAELRTALAAQTAKAKNAAALAAAVVSDTAQQQQHEQQRQLSSSFAANKERHQQRLASTAVVDQLRAQNMELLEASSKYQQQVSALTCTVAQRDDELTGIKQRLKITTHKQKMCEQRLTAMEETSQQQQRAHAELRRKYDDAVAAAETSVIVSQSSSAASDVTAAETAAATAKAELVNVQSSLAVVTERKKQLERDLARERAALEQLTETMSTRVRDLSAQHATVVAACSTSLQQQRDQAATQLAEAKSQLETQNTALEAARQEQRAQRAKHAGVVAELKAFTDQRDVSENNMCALAAQLSAANDRCESLAAQLAATQARELALEQQLRERETTAPTTTVDDATVVAAVEEADTARKQLAAMTTKLASTDAQLAQVQQQHADEMATVKARLTATQERLTAQAAQTAPATAAVAATPTLSVWEQRLADVADGRVRQFDTRAFTAKQALKREKRRAAKKTQRRAAEYAMSVTCDAEEQTTLKWTMGVMAVGVTLSFVAANLVTSGMF